MFGRKSSADVTKAQPVQTQDQEAIYQHMAVAEYDINKNFLYVSPEYSRMYNSSTEKMVEQPFSVNMFSGDINSPDTQDIWHNLFKGHSVSGTYRRIKDGDTEIWVNSTFTPVLNDSHQVDKIIEISTDVSEQYKSNQHNINILKAADRSMAIIEFDLESKVVNANENFLATVGYSLQEIQGRHHEMFCEREYSQSEEYRNLWARLKRGEFVQGRFKRLNKAGELVWLEASYNPIFNNKGEVCGYVKFATEITDIVEKNSKDTESAASAYSITTETEKVAAKGAEVVQEAAHEMEKITLAVSDTASVISELGQQSDEISSIVNTIRGIADQTNLLALNAAIEAARAGDQGRGFAVVADEVRQLAARTSNSTEEISGMINKIQSGTNTAIDSMNSCQKQAEHGMDLANQAGEVIVEIRKGTQDAVNAVSVFSDAMRG